MTPVYAVLTKDEFLRWLYRPTHEKDRVPAQYPGQRARNARLVRALPGDLVFVRRSA